MAGTLREQAGIGAGSRLIAMANDQPVADASDKWWVVDAWGRTTHVLIRSSALTPTATLQTVERQQAVRDRLDAATAAVVLMPERTGMHEGRSFSLFAYRRPLGRGLISRRVDRWRARRRVLRWLHDAVQCSAERVSGEAMQRRFVQPLEALMADNALPAAMRERAEQARQRIENGLWRPKSVIVHGDLWPNNVLFASGPYGIALIDWNLCEAHGPPFYDLVRFCRMARLGRRGVQAAVADHCRAVDCDPPDAMSNLLAGLGWLRQNLNHFPHERFVPLARGYVDMLAEASDKQR